MQKVIVSGFADEIDPYLNTQMDVLDTLGIRHIEIRGADGKNISKVTLEEGEEMAGRLAARGFKISAIGSPVGKSIITDDFAPALEQFRHCLALAKIFGAPYIRMFSFYPPKGGQIADFRDEVMRRWSVFLREAEGTGVTLLHENERDIYGDTVDRCLDLAETLGIALIFDPSNFIQAGEETYPSGLAKLKNHVKYMHIKDAKKETGEVMPAGYGDGFLANIIQELYESGFDGFLSLEPHLASFTGFAELEPDSPLNHLPPGGPKSFRIAADALFALLNKLEIPYC